MREMDIQRNCNLRQKKDIFECWIKSIFYHSHNMDGDVQWREWPSDYNKL